MLRLCALLVLAASSALAQPFPAPGEGVFAWARVGDRPLDTESFAFAPEGRLYAGRDTLYVFEPVAGGPPDGHWRVLGTPDGVPPITNALFVLDPAGDTLFSGRGSTIRRSVDGGATWTNVNQGIGIQPGGPDTPDGFYALPTGHPHARRLLAGGVLLYSDDRGATWTEATQDLPTTSQSSARTFAALPSGRVLAGTRSGVLGADDGGAAYLRTPLWGGYYLHALAPLATPGSAPTGAPACGLSEPALCDGAVAVGIATQVPGVRAWRTNDGGRTWSEAVALPEPDDGVGTSLSAGVVALPPGPDGLGRAITIGGRGIVRRTVDGGQTWDVIGRLPVRLGGASHVARLVRLGPDGHLWVSTTINGPEREWLYRSTKPAAVAFVVAGEPPPSGAPGFGVSVRPNPARGVAEVTLLPGASGRVVVTVLDALGREMARREADAASEPSLTVDTGSWPAGVYTVRAATGAGVATARLTVVR